MLATYCFVRAAFAKLIVYAVVVNMLDVCLFAVPACTDEAEAMAEVASALRAVGEGFLRMEERRLELLLGDGGRGQHRLVPGGAGSRGRTHGLLSGHRA